MEMLPMSGHWCQDKEKHDITYLTGLIKWLKEQGLRKLAKLQFNTKDNKLGRATTAQVLKGHVT